MIIKDIYDFIDECFPFSNASQWDNSGLIIGNINKKVNKCVLSLDVTDLEIDYAIKNNAQLIISHHPVIFKPQKNFLEGNIAYEAVKNDISIISAHTNFDKGIGGVNDTLCELLGYKYEKADAKIADGFLNISTPDSILELSSFVDIISKKLKGAVNYINSTDKVSKIGICSGAGADFLIEAKNCGCDTFLTGEASYHSFLDAKAIGINLITAGHFETEVIAMKKLKQLLENKFDSICFIEFKKNNPILMVK